MRCIRQFVAGQILVETCATVRRRAIVDAVVDVLPRIGMARRAREWIEARIRGVDGKAECSRGAAGQTRIGDILLAAYRIDHTVIGIAASLRDLAVDVPAI